MMRFEILMLSVFILQYNVNVDGRIADVTTQGCSVTKSCFKLPSGCTGQSDCRAFSSWSTVIQNGKRYLEIEMFGKVQSNQGYVAIGFNKKNDMNDAGVVGCYIGNPGSTVEFKGAYNGVYSNEFVNASSDFLVTSGPGSQERLGGYFDGSSQTIVCRVRRLLIPSINVEKLMNLSSPNLYYVLVSVSNRISTGGLGKHFDNGKAISNQAFEVGNVSNIETSDKLLFKTHGALMIVAWMLFATFGIIMARYMKTTWLNKTLCGQKVWFQVHRAAQVLCVLLSIIAFVIIFVKIGGYSRLTVLPDKVHPILGIIVMALALFNPILALFRPAPDSPKRPIFNWVHFCVGSMAQIFSVATIFIGVKLSNIGDTFSSSIYPFWILVGFVAFVVVMEIAFAIDQYCLTKKPTGSTLRNDRFGIQDGNVGESSAYINGDGVKYEVNHVRRSLLLAIYLIGVTGCTVALVVLLFAY